MVRKKQRRFLAKETSLFFLYQDQNQTEKGKENGYESNDRYNMGSHRGILSVFYEYRICHG
jgi:tRNA G10  N-methylase Trm11